MGKVGGSYRFDNCMCKQIVIFQITLYSVTQGFLRDPMAENESLIKNLEAQLNRLVAQLQDLEEIRCVC